MLGVGYNSFVPYVKDTLPKTYVVNNSQGSSYVSLHNEFINILVYHGAVGFGILLCFAICVLILWVKTVPKMEKEDGDYISVMAACVIAIGVSMFFLLEGIHTNSPGAFLLWTFLGYMMQYCAKKRKADS